MGLLSLLVGNQVATLSAHELRDQFEAGDRPFLLDVRQPAEYRLGHIHGAKLIPLGSLGARMNEIPPDCAIVCICATGHRSIPAARMLASSGHVASSLKDGMIAWKLAGLPVEKGLPE